MFLPASWSEIKPKISQVGVVKIADVSKKHTPFTVMMAE
jgi:hypothetical protein